MHSIINLLAIFACTGGALADDMFTLKIDILNVNLRGLLIHCRTYHVLQEDNRSSHNRIFPQTLNVSTAPRVDRVNVDRIQRDIQRQKPIISWHTPPPRAAETWKITAGRTTLSPTHLDGETIPPMTVARLATLSRLTSSTDP